MRSGPNVTICIIGGKINASVDELNAPTSDMIGPRFGTSAAKITAIEKIYVFLIFNIDAMYSQFASY